MSPTSLCLAPLVSLALAAPVGSEADASPAALPPWTPRAEIESATAPTEPQSERSSEGGAPTEPRAATERPSEGGAPTEPRTAASDDSTASDAKATRIGERPGEATASDAEAERVGERPGESTSSSSDAEARAPAPKPWEVGGFIDVNYGYNSNSPDNHVYRGTSVQPRTGEFTLNHVVAYVRRHAVPGELSPLFELAVQAGPAADALVAYEPNPGGANGKFAGPEVWKHLARANVGFRTRRGTELVAGLLLSPVGIGLHWNPYNWNYTATWQLNSVPYYLAGVKLAQTLRERHQLQLWLVNGWQLLADNNKAPSVMLGYTFAVSDRLGFAEYVWIGPEQADMRPRAWRLFSDSQVTYDTPRFGVAALFDIGGERRTDLPLSPWHTWMTAALFTRWRVLGEQRTWDMGLRPELFWDRDGRMYGVPQALVAGTFSNNFRVLDNLLLRLEYRYDHSTNSEGFFYRGPAISDGAPGLARAQHSVFFAVAGVFAHRFGGKRG